MLDDLCLKNRDTVHKAENVFSRFPFSMASMAHVQTFRNIDDELMQQLKVSGCFELLLALNPVHHRFYRKSTRQRMLKSLKIILQRFARQLLI
jgi:hypothetical protein